MITNADSGISLSPATNNGSSSPPYFVTTNGTSFSAVTGFVVPGQIEPGVTPMLQAQDGSFIGTVQVGNQTNMVVFDATGSVRWVIPNKTRKSPPPTGE